MKLVADTHALVWYFAGDERLSRRARQAFQQADAGRWTVLVPAIVLYETSLLESMGRLRFSYRELRQQLELRAGLPIEPLTPEDVDESRALLSIADPFDRLIAATALRVGVPLITCDANLTAAPALRAYW